MTPPATTPAASALRRAVQPVRSSIVDRVDRFAVERYARLVRRGERGRNVDAVERATLAAAQRLLNGSPTRVDAAAVDDLVTQAFRRLSDQDASGERRSPAVRRTVVDQFHRLYYHSPKQTWQQTEFRGVRVWKNPLDLWLYQEILHDVRPDVIVETGTKFGGSAYFLATMCDLMDHGRVVTIDIEEQPDRPEHPRITYLTGSSTDPAVVAHVDSILNFGTALVILDSDHRRNHVLEELRIWHQRVPMGSYVIVEDSNVNGHPVAETWGPGPMEALDAFLAENDAFVIDESQHKFFFTFNPRGYLKRVA